MWSSRRKELAERNAVLEMEIGRLRDRERGDSKVSEARDELDGLTIKWRGAAQQAAEELFEASRSRVERYGDATPGYMLGDGCLRGLAWAG